MFLGITSPISVSLSLILTLSGLDLCHGLYELLFAGSWARRMLSVNANKAPSAAKASEPSARLETMPARRPAQARSPWMGMILRVFSVVLS